MIMRYDKDYDKRLMKYIIHYTKQNRVPPTLELMLENVEGITSKSTLYNHLKKLTSVGLLVQKNVKGYYYPTCLDENTFIIKESLVKDIINCLKDLPQSDNHLNILIRLKNLENESVVSRANNMI